MKKIKKILLITIIGTIVVLIFNLFSSFAERDFENINENAIVYSNTEEGISYLNSNRIEYSGDAVSYFILGNQVGKYYLVFNDQNQTIQKPLTMLLISKYNFKTKFYIK